MSDLLLFDALKMWQLFTCNVPVNYKKKEERKKESEPISDTRKCAENPRKKHLEQEKTSFGF